MVRRDFRIIEEMARREPETAVLAHIWHELETPYDADDRLHNALTVGQRAVYALTWIWSEVNNGGLDQLFWNSTGYLMPEAIDGAARIGSPRWEDLLRSAAAVFPDPYPRDRADRQRLLDALSDPQAEVLSKLTDDFFDLDGSDDGLMLAINRYISENKAEFFRPAINEEEAAAALLTAARDILNTDYVLKNTPRETIEQLLDEAATRSEANGTGKTAALARSLRDQIPFFKT